MDLIKPVKIDSSENPISDWMRYVNLKSISKDDFPKNLISSSYFLEKIDGELNCMIYKKGEYPKFTTRSDMMRTSLLVLDEYKNILDNRSDIDSIEIMGEGTAINKAGRILPFNQTQSILKTAYKNLENNSMYHHNPFDIYSINGKRQTNIGNNLKLIELLFKRCKRIHPISYIFGDLDKAWDTFIKRPEIEGVVSRDHQNFKIKRSFSFDLAVIGVGRTDMPSWKNNQISYLKVAFMDKAGEFIFATNVGTGFSTKTREDLYKWTQLKGIKEEDKEIFVKPELIAEIKWLRIRKAQMPTYKYSEASKKYELIGYSPGYSLMQASLVNFRTDKKINTFDIGFRQIPRNLK